MVDRICQWIMAAIERLLMETDTVHPFREKISKKTRKTQLPPPRILVYGIFAATLFFLGLLILEIVHLILLRCLEPQVLNLMGYVVTFVVGAFFGAKRS